MRRAAWVAFSGGYECIQLQGTADTVLANATELRRFEGPSFVSHFEQSPLYCGTAFGVGRDNPVDPYTLTELQQARAVVAEIRNASSFRVTYHIMDCCATGRKYATAPRTLCMLAAAHNDAN